MYTTYPFLAIIVIAVPFFAIWLLIWLEKRDRDTLLALLPSGFVQYKPWSNEAVRQATVIEYAQVETITIKTKIAGILLIITGKDGGQKLVFLIWKYGGTSPSTRVHRDIAEQIISSHRHFSKQQKSSV